MKQISPSLEILNMKVGCPNKMIKKAKNKKMLKFPEKQISMKNTEVKEVRTSCQNIVDEIFDKIKKKTDSESLEKNKIVEKKKEKMKSFKKKLYIERSKEKTIVDKMIKRKHTLDGIPIYSLEELNIGNGGGTTLCPFDCDCCF